MRSKPVLFPGWCSSRPLRVAGCTRRRWAPSGREQTGRTGPARVESYYVARSWGQPYRRTSGLSSRDGICAGTCSPAGNQATAFRAARRRCCLTLPQHFRSGGNHPGGRSPENYIGQPAACGATAWHNANDASQKNGALKSLPPALQQGASVSKRS